MQISFMQKVDYWFGIPICFLLSLYERLLSLIFGKNPAKIQKILFIELSEMGSAILAYSSIKRAQQLVGDENVYFLIFQKNRESVDLLQCIPKSNVICIEDQSFLKFTLSTLSALWQIRKMNIDSCLDLELFSRCTTILSYLSGARNRVGFYNYEEEGLYRGSLITHRILYNPNLHIAKSFLSQVVVLEDSNPEEPLLKRNLEEFILPIPAYKPTSEEITNVDRILKSKGIESNLDNKLLLLNPDPGLLHLRGWPLSSYIELTRTLLQDFPEYKIGILGLPQSKKFAAAIQAAFPAGNIIDFTGATKDLAELVTLFQRSNVLITSDSGPAHMASLSNIKTIVLFGPETSVRYGPLPKSALSISSNLACSPCFSAANHRKSICRNNVCMQKIEVKEVIQALRVLTDNKI